jgi:hypothetical protein
MKTSKGPRTAPQTSDLNSLMNSYALAAAAAGVSLLAFAPAAEAEVVYTPQNSTLPLNKFVTMDLNHDGTPDFGFLFSTFAYHSFRGTLFVSALAGAGVIVPGGAGGYAAALFAGNNIGGSRSFGGLRENLIHSAGFDYNSSVYHRSVKGLWSNVTNRYLGVRFKDSEGATHYGWIRLTVSDARRPDKATITGYAYETVVDQPIKAGQITEEASVPPPSAPLAAPVKAAPIHAAPTLGALALGSTGLQFWRREDSALATQ